MSLPVEVDPTILPAVNMTPDLERAIAAATSAEAIRALVMDEAGKQSAAVAAAAAQTAADAKKAEADVAAAAAHAADTKEFTRTETIGGRDFEFAASSELELERMVNIALRTAYGIQTTDQAAAVGIAVDPAVAAAAAAKAEEQKALARVDLETRFKRGEVSAKDYIEQSGAMDEYLTSRGLSVESLKAAVDQNQNNQFAQSWEEAAEFFRVHTADWPGGDANKHILGLQVAALGLVDAEDKVGALARAFQEMKNSGIIVAHTETATDPAATAAATAVAEAARVAAAAVVPTQTAAQLAVAHAEAELVRVRAAALALKTPSTSSSLFGRSSGTDVVVPVKKTGDQEVIEIPKDATPAEIVDAWKKGQIAQGKDPNAAFMETFRGGSPR